ncbi:hypothetical protein MRY82_00085 [bacterium]|nr:hypothetical protein [bacterium]
MFKKTIIFLAIAMASFNLYAQEVSFFNLSDEEVEAHYALVMGGRRQVLEFLKNNRKHREYFRCLAQGCNLNDKVQYQMEQYIPQYNRNGHWMGIHLGERDYNGGQNPIFSERNRYNQLQNIVEHQGTTYTYSAQAEYKALDKQRRHLPGLSQQKVGEIVHATGYIRMTQKHWFYILEQIRKDLSVGGVSDWAIVDVVCPKTTEMHINYDMTPIYKYRMRLATKNSGLRDWQGKLIYHHIKTLGHDSQGKPYFSLPTACGEQWVFNSDHLPNISEIQWN